jgi:hypothetical protein
MRYHVPFSQRNQLRPPGPIYIGFDQPVSIQRRRGRFNWSGFVGLLLALISPLTLFLAAPFALLFSLVGLRRSPRGMAVVGTVISLAATAALTLMITGAVRHRVHVHHQHQRQVVAAENREKTAETAITMKQAEARLLVYREDHKNFLPELAEGMDITVQYRDAWERELFYEPVKGGCVIRSAGPDGEFLTSDDVTCQVSGLTAEGPIASEQAAIDSAADPATSEDAPRQTD